ncbi:MAG: hypothetical protein PHW12_00685 [Smithella sp.]|nr:hypothetical protein [Smithella sp.]MDD5672582.1 hypothetical protein [Chitinivibrionales bacterium]
MSDTVVMDFGDFDVATPTTYCVGEHMKNIFSVPVKDAVGTNEIDNAVSVLHFKKDNEIKREEVKKDFMEMVSGPFDFRFLPLWSEKEIAYSQTKGFLLVNIPEKKVEIYTICPGITQGDIGNVAVLNGKNKTFVFEILTSDGNAKGETWNDKILRVIRFENDTFTVIAEHPAGIKTLSYSEPWFTYQSTIFIYNDSTTKLEAFDEKFQPVKHPLSEAFNANSKTFRCLLGISIHPRLPFAIIVEIGKDPDQKKLDSIPPGQFAKLSKPLYDETGRRTLYLFRWQNPDAKQQLVPLVSVTGSIWKSYNPENSYEDFSFSPDGKWVVFRDLSKSSTNPIFVAVPINEKNPLYLGKPIKLGRASREDAIGPTATCWASDPTAFVMCDGLAIYKWDLGNFDKEEHVTMPPDAKSPY